MFIDIYEVNAKQYDNQLCVGGINGYSVTPTASQPQQPHHLAALKLSNRCERWVPEQRNKHWGTIQHPDQFRKVRFSILVFSYA